MPKEQHGLREEWIKLAPHWIAEARQGGDVPRKGMLDAYMLAACGDVQGMSILDSGCGEGRFCRMLAERGAGFVVGVDTCEPMIEAARELQSSKEEYILGDVEHMPFLQDESFDLGVSYLNHCDLADFEANVHEVFRVLKDGGRFIIVNIHPMRSATGLWQRQPDGTKVHVILDDYFAEGERHFKMKGVEITNFHRTLATYVRGFLKAGFILEDIIEPTVSAEMVERYPELDDELRVPNFIIYILKKPQGALASL
jgi:ubiquinone/menaquinone biosynthesis C-methylase UbiE